MTAIADPMSPVVDRFGRLVRLNGPLRPDGQHVSADHNHPAGEHKFLRLVGLVRQLLFDKSRFGVSAACLGWFGRARLPYRSGCWQAWAHRV